MTLVLTFAGLALGLAVLFAGGGRFLQAYLYNEPARHLPVRGFAAGLLVAAFLAVWVAVNTRGEARDRYGTLFEFNPTASLPLDRFDAVRRYADGHETVVPYQKTAGRFVQATNPDRRFALTTSDYLVVAVDVPDPGTGEKARFAADLFTPDEADPKKLRPVRPGETPATLKFAATGPRVFREVGGPRYVEFGAGGDASPLFAPSRAALAVALALNLGSFVAWLAALWLVMRFSLRHAIGLAASAWAAALVVGMPLLFELNRGFTTETQRTQSRENPKADQQN
jgi:hypothetical protein